MRDAVGVVEEDAAAPDLGVERLDAQEVGVELNDLGVNGIVGDEPDVLVRDEEQEGAGAEGENVPEPDSIRKVEK